MNRSGLIRALAAASLLLTVGTPAARTAPVYSATQGFELEKAVPSARRATPAQRKFYESRRFLGGSESLPPWIDRHGHLLRRVRRSVAARSVAGAHRRRGGR